MIPSALARPAELRALLGGRGLGATLLRGTAGSCATKVAANGLLFASQIVFARLLGIEGYAVYVLALAWLGVLVMVGRLGFDLATVRFVAAYHGRGAWPLLRGFLTAARALAAGASLVIAAILAAAAALLESRLGATMTQALWLVAATVPVLSLIQIEASAVRGLGRVVLGEVTHAVGHPAAMLAGFLAAVLWLGAPATPETALAAYLGAALVSLAVLRPLLARLLPAAARRARRAGRGRAWRGAAAAMMLVAGFGVLLNQSTTILTGLLAGTTEAGLFGAASRIAGVLQIITFSLITAMAPMAARLHAERRHEKLQQAITVGVRAVFAAALAAALVLVLFGGPLLRLFGPDFVAAREAMLVLAAGQLAWAWCAPAGVVLNMTGHQNLSARILAGAAVLNLVLCAALIPPFGLIGAAMATAATMAAWNAAMVLAVRRRLGLDAFVTFARPRGRAAGR